MWHSKVKKKALQNQKAKVHRVILIDFSQQVFDELEMENDEKIKVQINLLKSK